MGVGSMDNNRQHAVFREILLEEMKTDIVMAKEGQMPPSLYQNRLQDLKNAMEAALISKQAYESLSRQFQTSVKVQSKSQIKRMRNVALRSPMEVFSISGKGPAILWS